MKKLVMAILGITLIGTIYAFPPWMIVQSQTVEGETTNSSDILKNVTIEEYITPAGYKIYGLVKNGEVVGVLWNNVDLNKITVGNPIYTWWGAKYPLYYNGYLVGFVNDYSNNNYNYPPRGWGGCCCGRPYWWHN
ncbi:MAG: hypothetical protein ABGW92_02725 [Methanocaldococcus sp.]